MSAVPEAVRSTALIERITPAQWRAAEHDLRGRRPLVVEGAFRDTEAVRTWSPQHLAAAFGDVPVIAMRMTAAAWADFAAAPSEVVTLARFVRDLLDGRDVQLMTQPITSVRAMVDQLELTRFAPEPHRSVNLHVSRGTRTPLHVDRSENFLVQVHGPKRVVVEPPDSPAGSYMHGGRNRHVCRVDPDQVDAERFPDYDPGLQQRAVLAPGDALYLPPLWFHHLTAPGTSISVNVWHGARSAPVREVGP